MNQDLPEVDQIELRLLRGGCRPQSGMMAAAGALLLGAGAKYIAAGTGISLTKVLHVRDTLEIPAHRKRGIRWQRFVIPVKIADVQSLQAKADLRQELLATYLGNELARLAAEERGEPPGPRRRDRNGSRDLTPEEWAAVRKWAGSAQPKPKTSRAAARAALEPTEPPRPPATRSKPTPGPAHLRPRQHGERRPPPGLRYPPRS